MIDGPSLTGTAFTASSGTLADRQRVQHEERIQKVRTISFARDVSDSLIAHQELHRVRVPQEATVKNLADSVSTSLVPYQGGIAIYLDVLDFDRKEPKSISERNRQTVSRRSGAQRGNHVACQDEPTSSSFRQLVPDRI
jgi:hypothetical protein